LEDLIVEPFPEIEGFDTTRVRLVPGDAPPKLQRDRYWVLALTGQALEPPEGFEARVIRELDTVTLTEWQNISGRRTTLLSERVRSVAAAYVPEVGGETIACDRWIFGRLVCGPHPWNWVGQRDITVNGKME